MNNQSRLRLWPTAIALGLLLALDATGGAVAGTLITSKTIKDDTIKPRDLDFVTGVEAASLHGPIDLTTTPTTVLTATMTIDDGGGLAVAQADLSLTNTTDAPIDVTVQLVHKQDPDHVEVFRTTVPAFGSDSLPAGIQCNWFPSGDQTVEVRAWGFTPGITVERGFLTMVAGPHL